MGRALGPLLEGPPVSLRDWNGREDGEKGWLLRIEFAAILSMIVGALAVAIASYF